MSVHSLDENLCMFNGPLISHVSSNSAKPI